MQEAIELAGIFIDAGPVGQYKSKDAKVVTLKDVNRGTIYDGPLMVMVNGYSASASEILAGTLQDYNRAVIFGSPTYGKATAQVVLPMDTSINLESDPSKKKADSYVKVTVSQLFRITGRTAQANGVKPDVFVPDYLEAQGEREADNVYAIKSTEIEANKYFKPGAALPTSVLNDAAKSKIETSAFFTRLQKYIADTKATQQKKDMSLRLQDALQQKRPPETAPKNEEKADASIFTIATHAYETQRAAVNSSAKALDEQWKHFLSIDPYVKLAYQVMLLMPK